MSKNNGSLLAVLALVSITGAGCTSTGLSFGLPAASLNGPLYGDATAAVKDLKARNQGYLLAASRTANSTQWFDVPAILAGTMGVAATAFEHAGSDLAPAAGTLAVGALGFRSYYAPGPRTGAYAGGARATSCLLGLATTLESKGLTATKVQTWNDILATAQSNPSAPSSTEAAATAAAIVSAPSRLATAAVRVDSEVMRKLQAPAAPDLSSYMQTYQTAVQRSETEKRLLSNAQASTAEGLVATKLKGQIPSDTAIIEAVKDLDPKIEQCIGYAV